MLSPRTWTCGAVRRSSGTVVQLLTKNVALKYGDQMNIIDQERINVVYLLLSPLDSSPYVFMRLRKTNFFLFRTGIARDRQTADLLR